MRRTCPLVALAIGVLSFAFCWRAGRSDGLSNTTTVCAVTAKPWAFHNVKLQLRGFIIVDGHERISLVDERCPGEGLTLVPFKSNNAAGLREVREAIRRRHDIDNMNKNIEATFVGTFRWHPFSQPSRTIAVERGWDVKLVGAPAQILQGSPAPPTPP